MAARGRATLTLETEFFVFAVFLGSTFETQNDGWKKWFAVAWHNCLVPMDHGWDSFSDRLTPQTLALAHTCARVPQLDGDGLRAQRVVQHQRVRGVHVGEFKGLRAVLGCLARLGGRRRALLGLATGEGDAAREIGCKMISDNQGRKQCGVEQPPCSRRT